LCPKLKKIHEIIQSYPPKGPLKKCSFKNFIFIFKGTRKFNFSSRPTRQHWPRFSMHIEFDQKRSIWNIRVEGKVENEIQAPVHNMKKNKSGVTY
jgi:hypothetical protein